MRTYLRASLGLVGVAAALLVAPSALAYQGTVPVQVSIDLEATCLETGAAIATVVDGDGAPVMGQTVSWSFAAGKKAGDIISPASSSTNANGQATSEITLSPTPGDRTVMAKVGDASATAIVTCGELLGATPGPTGQPTGVGPGTGGSGGPAAAPKPTPPFTGGLPRTDTLQKQSGAVPVWLLLLPMSVLGLALSRLRKSQG